YQSGQPWEAWNVEVYRNLTGSTSDTSRYAEPAGSRTTSAHYQIDLNYTQNFKLGSRYNIQVRADVFNIFDRQTGYNIQNKVNSSGFGDPRSFYDPRRLQLAVKFQF
ncbi:MAG: carboxypeptidase regulatory-like domain-containing protein, partial [Acidobacteria bacterium]|nr:carboxypeptidase regulatory-like domain-containing protein [Acidobacteriota bacterium]